MVRPEGAHSELSQKADLTPFSRSGLPYPLRIGGFGALCNPETSLWVRVAKMEGITGGGVSKDTWTAFGMDLLLRRGLLFGVVQKKGPRKKRRMLVGGDESEKKEFPLNGFIFTAKKRHTRLLSVSFSDSSTFLPGNRRPIYLILLFFIFVRGVHLIQLVMLYRLGNECLY